MIVIVLILLFSSSSPSWQGTPSLNTLSYESIKLGLRAQNEASMVLASARTCVILRSRMVSKKEEVCIMDWEIYNRHECIAYWLTCLYHELSNPKYICIIMECIINYPICNTYICITNWSICNLYRSGTP